MVDYASFTGTQQWNQNNSSVDLQSGRQPKTSSLPHFPSEAPKHWTIHSSGNACISLIINVYIPGKHCKVSELTYNIQNFPVCYNLKEFSFYWKYTAYIQIRKYTYVYKVISRGTLTKTHTKDLVNEVALGYGDEGDKGVFSDMVDNPSKDTEVRDIIWPISGRLNRPVGPNRKVYEKMT